MEPSSRGRAAFWMVAILVITTLANVAIGQIVPRQARPVIVRDGGSLFELVASGQRSVGQRYGMYIWLGEQEGHRLYSFRGSGLVARLLEAFGRMELQVVDYSPEGHNLPGLGEPTGELQLDTGVVIPYWSLPGNPGDDYWIAVHEEGYVLVPDSVLPVPRQ
jgi:hypothetical protein